MNNFTSTTERFAQYSNKKDLEELQQTLFSISPDLRLETFTLEPNGSRVIRAGLYIREKGNKRIIQKLLSIGFQKANRTCKKIAPWDAFSSYEYIVTLCKPL